jgi:4-amino-4-deoxy-L-arabinose transferase-like glycosyltransferase
LLFGLVCASSNSATFTVVTIAFFSIWKVDRRTKFFNRQSIAFILGASAIIIPWNTYVGTLDLDEQAIISNRNGVQSNYFLESSPLSQNSQRIQAAGALLFLGPEIYPGLDPKISAVGREQIIFGNPINYHRWSACNRRFEAPEYIKNFVKPLLKDQCFSNWALVFQSSISKSLLPLLPLSGIALVMNLGIAISNRDLRRLKLTLIPVLTILAYAFKGGGVSRYSSPFLIFGPLLIVLVVYQYSNWNDRHSKVQRRNKS